MVMRYRDGKWQDDDLPEYHIGKNTNKYAQPLQNSYGQGSVSPTYYQNRAPEPAPVAAPQPVAAPSPAGITSNPAQLKDLLGMNAAAPAGVAPTAPTSNQFGDAMKQYLASSGPTAPTSNAFTQPLQSFLNSSAPTAEKATMGTNRFAGGLTAAEQRLQDLISNPSALQDSASYKFRVQQGQEALQRSLGAKGLLRSGNRLQELTKYGQDMGSQEYEAENARRMAMLKEYGANYNTDQANNVNLLNVQQGSMDKQYGTAADLYSKRGATLADLYGGEATANNQRFNIASDAYNTRGTTLANLFGNQNQADTSRYVADTSRYGTDVGAATDRVKTLADLYRTDTNAAVQREATAAGRIADQPWWVGKYDQYGRPIA